METSELLQALNARGHHLLAASEDPNDGATDMGLVLLALERLLTLATSAETVSASQQAAAGFKAKSNRW